MKKVKCIVSTLFLVAIGVTIFWACEKEETTANSSVISKSYKTQKDMSNLRVYYDNGGEDYGCNSSGGNCLPDVIIHGNNISTLETIFDYIYEIRDVYQTQTIADTLISDIVYNNQSELLEILSQEKINDIINYNVNLYIRGHGTYRCLLLCQGLDIIEVNPVLFDN